jgi:AcrR family transcriptional regulator
VTGISPASEGARFSRLAPDDRREQILIAAREVFSRSPYARVSVGEIAEEAGVTRGLLHHYFGGKRELFIEVVRTMQDELAGSVRTDLRDLPIEEMVSANADSWLDAIERNRELANAVLGASAFGDNEVAKMLDDAREALLDRILVNQMGTSEVPPQVRLLLRGYLGLAESASREWLTHGRATREEVHALLVEGLLALTRVALRKMAGTAGS